MKIALDAMGGDLAPRSPVVGTLQFLQDQTSGMEIILVGDQTILKEELGDSIPKGIRIHHTTHFHITEQHRIAADNQAAVFHIPLQKSLKIQYRPY